MALLTYSKAECSFEDRLVLAKDEQTTRYLNARKEKQYQAELQEACRKADLERQLAYDKATFEKQLAYDNDPKNITKAKQSKLRDKYNFSYFIEKGDFTKLMEILQKIDNKTRISDDDKVWLRVAGRKSFTGKLKDLYHCIGRVCRYLLGLN